MSKPDEFGSFPMIGVVLGEHQMFTRFDPEWDAKKISQVVKTCRGHLQDAVERVASNDPS